MSSETKYDIPFGRPWLDDDDRATLDVHRTTRKKA